MKCESIREDLNAFVDGELSPLRAWRVGRHLRTCTDCSAQVERYRQLHSLLRANDLFPPKPLLQTASNTTALREPQRKLSLSMAGGMLATGAIVALFLVFSRSPEVRAETVGKALAQAKTWHLQGWRLIDGRKVPWEVWGCRAPYFYREQIGNTLQQEDSIMRIRVVPADPRGGRVHPVVLMTERNTDTLWENGGLSYRTMVNAADWFGSQTPSYFRPTRWKETHTETIFRVTESTGMMDTSRTSLYTVNRRTGLPVSYRSEIRQRTDGKETSTANEFLRAVYNIPFPANITYPKWSSDYRIVDLRNAHPEAIRHAQNVVSANGLTAQATLVAVDHEGDVLIRIRGWLGGIRLHSVYSSQGLLHLAVNLSNKGQAILPVQGGNRVSLANGDDQERPYLIVQSALTSLPNGDWYVVLAPLDPQAATDPHANRLQFTLALTPMTSLRAGNITDAPMDARLFTQDFTWTVPTLHTKAQASLAAFYPPQHRKFQGDQSLEAAIANERAGEFYMSGRVCERSNPPQSRALLQKAVTWKERSLTLGKTSTLEQSQERYTLALLQAYAGDTVGTAKTLQSVLAEARQHHGWSQLQRQAIHALHHLNAPGSWDEGW